MNNTLWGILSFLTFAIGYGLGIFANRYEEKRIVESIEDVEELLLELKELGFLKFENVTGLLSEETINDLKKMLEESEFSSNDEMHHPNTGE